MVENRKAGIATSLQALPVEDRPREKLLRAGGGALSDAELIAVLLRTGRPGLSAIEMGSELLAERGGLVGLLRSGAITLRRRGLGEAKAATLLAAIELGRRLARARMPRRDLLDRPDAVANYLSLRYVQQDQEVMGALYLDVRNRLIAESDIYRGTLSRAAVEPRAILKEGLLRSASGFVLFHTHPSGDPSPSTEDIAFTRRLSEAGKLVGIKLLDHLILGSGGRWVSLGRRGAW
ncbi:MAG: DNA repair protein RadC [Acidobacteriota bacterium]